MITFMEFIREDDAGFDIESFLHRECQPFFDASKGSGLAVRGISQAGPVIGKFNTPSSRHPIPVHKMTVRKDRKTLSTPEVYHHAIDEWMKDKFGIAGRTGSVFVFGERSADSTENYGARYFVIPRGEFKFIWSPKVADLYDTMLEEFGPVFNHGDVGELPPGEVTEYMNTLQYSDRDFNAALQSGNEIMIDCQNYYAIPYTATTGEYIEQLMK